MIRQTRRYQLEELLSENAFSQTWRATVRASGLACVVKVARDGQSFDTERANHLLLSSFRLQQAIHSPGILSGISSCTEEGLIYVEYPFLTGGNWTILTPETFGASLPQALAQVCEASDYLHLLGLVHGDLKLDNFLSNQAADGRCRTIMVDMDFLCLDESRPDALLFGTPEHIAPELTANEKITVQSDNYSLGVSIRHYLAAMGDQPLDSETQRVIVRLRSSLDQLLDPSYVRRPRMLIDFLAENDILPRTMLDAMERRLRTRFWMSRLRLASRRKLSDESALGKFVCGSCRLLGFHPDAFALLAQTAEKAPRASLRATLNVLRSSQIVRRGEFWHFRVGDDRLRAFYEALERLVSPPADRRKAGVTPDELIHRVNQLKESGAPERSFLLMQKHLLQVRKSAGASGKAMLRQALVEVSKAATDVNRPQAALEYIEEAYSLCDARDNDRSAILFELALLLVKRGDYNRAIAMVTEIMESVPRPKEIALRLQARRLRGLIYLLLSDYAEAEPLLTSVAGEARESGVVEVESLAHYSLGVLSLRRGNLTGALRELDTALTLSKSHKLNQIYIGCAMARGIVCSELGEYSEAFRYGKLAADAAEAAHNTSLARSSYYMMVTACTRLTDYPKAHFWLERCLGACADEFPDTQLQFYLVTEGFVKLSEGDLGGAESSLYRALSIVSSNVPTITTLKAYQNLVVLDLMRGELERCKEHIARARRELEVVKDSTSEAEIDFWDLLVGYYSTGEDIRGRLDILIRRLAEIKSSYYCALGILQRELLTEDDAESSFKVTDFPFLSQKECPLFEAVSLILNAHAESWSFGESVKALKQAFTIMTRGRGLFWGALIAERLGAIYDEQRLFAHARKFFVKGRELAEHLHNPFLIERLERGLAVQEQLSGDVSVTIASYVSISKILRDMTDFRGSLDRLIQFAVEQTGAERGVLMLKKADGSGLQVGAAVNCDEQSLSDVLQFSARLPLSAFEQARPIVVDDATKDDRTKHFKSVVVHNVRSVACIPLMQGRDSVGVLYLDHHSIPALFEATDLAYLDSIANFLTVFLTKAKEVRLLTTAHSDLTSELNSLGTIGAFITQDPKMLRMLTQLPQVARTNVSVLLLGESGTGKELLARLIHNTSLRSREPLVKLNCAALAPSMIESELFGVAKNVATGVSERDGKFFAADGGTLFLDEIGDMPVDLQAKVLRVLEYQEFERVGSNRQIRVDIRFVYATNKDLAGLIEQSKFREDLYHRINTISIQVLPLRDRPTDIPLMLDHYLNLFSMGGIRTHFTNDALDALVAYRWPGNARELRNLVERTCILYPGEKVDVSKLPLDTSKIQVILGGVDSPAARAEIAAIRASLVRAKGNQARASRELGIPLSTLRRKIKKYHIRIDL
ncbi:MAG: sigma 54-interacting transcriptional regulator [Candidatus Zixiibacteriota bacterium]